VFSDNRMAGVGPTYSYLNIYGSHVFVFSNPDEDAPWQNATYDTNDPEKVDLLDNMPQPSYSAYAAQQAAELWRTASEYESRSHLFSTADYPPTSNVPFRLVILELVSTADTIVYNKIRDIAFTRTADFDQKQELWNRTRRSLDLFSTCLADWLPHVGDNEAHEKLGYSRNGGGRLQWITILQRLRNRFVHRSPYFLELDFQEMKNHLTLDIGTRRAQVFIAFVQDVATKIHRMANLNTAA
jgi:hypothetical protein